MTTHLNTRRHDLDWLRIIAFGLLIFYHIGMFYVSWGWHVKSVHAGQTGESLMKLINPWRIPLLFLISGIAIRFAIDKAKLGAFAWRRTLRLFIPIAFGIFVIVAPQAYLQLLENGETTKTFLQFYPEYAWGSFDTYSVILPTWNHLWYVVYLMFYTLILIPIARPLSRFMTGTGAKFSHKLFGGRFGVLAIMIIGALPFLVYQFWLVPIFPSTHALVDDWAGHQLYLMIFIMGFVVAKDAAFWQAVHRAFIPTLFISLSLALLALIVWQFNFKGSSIFSLNVIEFVSEKIRKSIYAWLVILSVFGAAQRWLNRPSKALMYMTEAIFPWYILHQTITIISGYWLTRQGLSLGVEFILVSVFTFLGCALLHEFFIRRIRWVRPLFGLKFNPYNSKKSLTS